MIPLGWIWSVITAYTTGTLDVDLANGHVIDKRFVRLVIST